jgi:hypothetical protein
MEPIINIIKNNFDNKYKLSELVDEYMIPQELEKKQNVEITTHIN